MNASPVTASPTLRRSAIQILRADHERLADLVDRSLSGRDAALAEQLGEELDRAVVTDARPEGVVGMEDRVTYEDEATGVRREVTLSWPGQTDPSAGRISVLAPVGVALIGLSVGDHFDQRLPDGRVARLRIVAVQP